MKITVYSRKGGQGKTPIALNMAFEEGLGLCTNEDTPNLHEFLELNKELIVVEPNQEFPQLPLDVEVVFDLGGMMNNSVESITSAIEQSDVVVVPIVNSKDGILGGAKTIAEVSELTPNIVVVANKLGSPGKGKSYEEGRDFQTIKKHLEAHGFGHLPVLPLKVSSAFEDMYVHKMSIRDFTEGTDENGDTYVFPMTVKWYLEVADQFDRIVSYLRENYGN